MDARVEPAHDESEFAQLDITRPCICYPGGERRWHAMTRFGSLIAFVIATACWWSAAAAQDQYPARTVKIVVPAAPGSTTDTFARVVADQLSRKWSRPVIVDNMPGVAMHI